MTDPNPSLIVSYDFNHTEVARNNVESVLREIGAIASVVEADSHGVFEVIADRNPHELVRAAREMCKRDPSRFAHTHHWRPVEVSTPAELPAMKRAVGELGRKIDPEETWKLSVDAHGDTRWRARDLVKPLTEPVLHGQVRMNDPEKLIRVDLFPDHADIALLGRGDDLSVDQVRDRAMSLPQDV